MGLTYQAWGEGERPILLVHGFTGNRHSWDLLRPALSPEVRAIAVDLPGHGDSPPLTRRAGSAFGRTVEALAEVLDSLDSSPVDVLGYSLGARFALALAVRAPGRVRRLVLESGNPGLEHPRERARREAADERAAQAVEAGGVAAFVDRWEALPLLASLQRLPEPVKRAIRARRLSCTAEGLAAALRGWGLAQQPNYWPMLPSLRAPTLLLTGREDAKFTAIARRMRSELRLGWHRAFDRCGHAPHLEAPQPYAEEVLSFLGAPNFAAAERFGT